MSRYNTMITEGINNSLKEYALEHYEEFYPLAFSYMKNEKHAMEVVTEVIRLSLFNGRKLKDLPPMKMWYYQLLVRYGMRAMFRERNYEREFTKDSKLYAFMETIEPASTNVFKLRYLEGMDEKDVSSILNIKKDEVDNKLRLVLSHLKIDSSLDEESTEKLDEIKRVYFSQKAPKELRALVEEAIYEEGVAYEKGESKRNKLKWVKALGVFVLAFLIFFITIKLASDNPDFRDKVLALPFLGNLFSSFL